jgi:hypothetical protein
LVGPTDAKLPAEMLALFSLSGGGGLTSISDGNVTANVSGVAQVPGHPGDGIARPRIWLGRGRHLVPGLYGLGSFASRLQGPTAPNGRNGGNTIVDVSWRRSDGNPRWGCAGQHNWVYANSSWHDSQRTPRPRTQFHPKVPSFIEAYRLGKRCLQVR